MVETGWWWSTRRPGPSTLNEATIFRWWKLLGAREYGQQQILPSMKPPSFDGGNGRSHGGERRDRSVPSMKPPSFDGGNTMVWQGNVENDKTLNEATIFRWWKRARASRGRPDHGPPSMKPPSFDGGNGRWWHRSARVTRGPSMKPPSFDGGNMIATADAMSLGIAPQ